MQEIRISTTFLCSRLTLFSCCLRLSLTSFSLWRFTMVSKGFSVPDLTEIGCCACFGFFSRAQRSLRSIHGADNQFSQELLLSDDEEDTVRFLRNGELVEEDADRFLYNGELVSTVRRRDGKVPRRNKSSEELLLLRAQSGLICREIPVKETRHVIRSEDENGNKMVNEYVRECKIGSGSYGKVVLYRSTIDGKPYAIKAFHKSHLLKLRVAPSETAMSDVLREVSIMKMLEHPNIVNLVEVIDDPNADHFYMVLEFVEGKRVCQDSGPMGGGIGESTARRYFRDIIAGLEYLHAHNIVHGDIKPDNLLVSSSGLVKIGDFGVSQAFEDDNDELRRSPGTPVFTAPECCLGLTYHGKAADTWALGITLYCMVLGEYPFLGDTLQDTYDKIVNNPLSIPDSISPLLKNLLEGLLCKDPEERIDLEAVAAHPWVVEEGGPIPAYLCYCKRRSFQGTESPESRMNENRTELAQNGNADNGAVIILNC